MKSALAAAALLMAALASHAQTASAAFPYEADGATAADATSEYLAAKARWHNELAAFARADQERLPPPGGVVFVGSSTVRMWTRLAQDFARVPGGVVNRGFGGSTLADCSLFARELVVRYKPRQVVVYAGDNDLAEGRTPLQVLDSFARFANTVRAELPDARISFISVKPSPSREQLMPQIRETNHVISAYLNLLPNSEFIDIYTPMLGADGRPRMELFRGDRLHMTDEGYRLWHSVIASHLPGANLPSAPASLP
ncbi:lysophospholipase L1-like esterase [Variovorax boronicumulans]|uniref:SGNH/GDSL hydrolase family protein n=1 Tax=Variovorax TaxID=34072 RepID=UPI00278843DC|nr:MULTISPECIES: SGNH/GDSL hydrolase family protein [Variovorax]MDQ0037969.1 lysophospholipase L1-like esterase [Variovorax boronicumulans]MDQ0041684.1 lysophospholipase L1-like esterase [Variovorax boronicumulans]MDQ0610044.1 lysophospholipase L1-like esterase [Variovorax sp. W1I1]